MAKPAVKVLTQMSVTGIWMSKTAKAQPTNMKNQQGFTLLEMMLVVILIAITVTFVNLNSETFDHLSFTAVFQFTYVA